MILEFFVSRQNAPIQGVNNNSPKSPSARDQPTSIEMTEHGEKQGEERAPVDSGKQEGNGVKHQVTVQ